MKKLITLLLLLALVASLQAPALALEASVPTLALTGAQSRAGQSVALTLSVAGNPGTAALRVSVTYDDRALALLPDGVLLTLRFKIAADAAAGDYPVAVSCLDSNNADENVVTWASAVGTVAVRETLPSESARVSLSSAAGARGQIVPVTLTIANNPGVAALAASVSFDGDALTLLAAEGADEVFDTSQLTASEKGSSPYSLSFLAQEDSRTDGKLATLYFRVSEQAAQGEYDITISSLEAYGVDESAKSLLRDKGTLTVSAASALVADGERLADGARGRADRQPRSPRRARRNADGQAVFPRQRRKPPPTRRGARRRL